MKTFTHYTSLHTMTLKLKHTFIIIVARRGICRISTFVIRLLPIRRQLCDIAVENIVRCHSEKNAQMNLKSKLLVKKYQTLKTPRNITTLIRVGCFVGLCSFYKSEPFI